MSTAARIEYTENESPALRWSLATRLAFRFCFLYFGLFCVLGVFGFNTLLPVRPVVFGVADHIFHPHSPFVYGGSGSGDKAFDWAFHVCLLTFAPLATLVWSISDRARANYITLHKWFRLFIRFVLASQMLTYGFIKIVPLQMPFPALTRLLEPVGNLSPMGMLWTSIGSSPAYETFAGCAEALGGILLIFPRTATFGALVCLADMIQVFMLNMTYDVPVKILSSHLALLSLLLLAPELPRMRDFFFLNRTTAPSTQFAPFPTRRANRIAVTLQWIFGVLLIGGHLIELGTYPGFTARTKSPLYGIWSLDDSSGESIPWARRIVFDRPDLVAFQRSDDSFVLYRATINTERRAIALSGGTTAGGTLTYQRRDGELILDGIMDGRPTHVALHEVTRQFPLVNRGFHWIQDYPFNR